MWTYDMLLNTPLDRVRLLIGDTDITDQLLQDEEIQALYDNTKDMYAAASQACAMLAAKFAREVDITLGRTRSSNSQMVSHYNALARKYKAHANSSYMFVGGVHKPTVQTPKVFHVGMFDSKE